MMDVLDFFYPSMPRLEMKFSSDIPKAAPERPMREFMVKGIRIKAYSRKDAIKRLKYRKLI